MSSTRKITSANRNKRWTGPFCHVLRTTTYFHPKFSGRFRNFIGYWAERIWKLTKFVDFLSPGNHLASYSPVNDRNCKVFFSWNSQTWKFQSTLPWCDWMRQSPHSVTLWLPADKPKFMSQVPRPQTTHYKNWLGLDWDNVRSLIGGQRKKKVSIGKTVGIVVSCQPWAFNWIELDE